MEICVYAFIMHTHCAYHYSFFVWYDSLYIRLHYSQGNQNIKRQLVFIKRRHETIINVITSKLYESVVSFES